MKPEMKAAIEHEEAQLVRFTSPLRYVKRKKTQSLTLSTQSVYCIRKMNQTE